MTEEQNVQPIQPAAPVQQTLPNATAVLVLGIISIPTCVCWGIVGLTLGIIALVMAGKAKKLYEDNPSFFTESSFNNLKAGRICAIIGLCLSSLVIVYYIVVLLFYGAMMSALPWDDILNY